MHIKLVLSRNPTRFNKRHKRTPAGPGGKKFNIARNVSSTQQDSNGIHSPRKIA